MNYSQRLSCRAFLYWLPVACLANLLCFPQSLTAISISISFVSIPSDHPAWDPDGLKLKSTFEAAADIWEDLIPGNGNYAISVHWDDNTIPLGALYSNHAVAVDTFTDWFFDATPLSHNEYDFEIRQFTPSGSSYFYEGEWLYHHAQALPAPGLSSWFTGTPPQTLEVGYTGLAHSAGAGGKYDLLSFALGMLGTDLLADPFKATSAAISIPPAWNGNASLNIEQSHGKLEAEPALLSSHLIQGVRVLPSAVDVMAVAASRGYGTIDLDRKDYRAGSGSWSAGINWIGGSTPDGDDDAFIRSPTINPTVELAGLSVARNLFVGQGDDLSTNAYKLDISNTITIDGSSSSIEVNAAGEAEAIETRVQNQADLFVYGGLVDTQRLVTQTGGSIFGNNGGQISLQDSFTNDGSIQGGSGTFTISGGPSTSWDLDGSDGDGVVAVNGGVLGFVGGSVSDDFNGTMTVGPGGNLSIFDSWNLGAGGEIQLYGGSTSSTAAKIFSGITVLSSTAKINSYGYAYVLGATTINAGQVNIDSTSNFEFSQPVHVNGGSYSVGSGSLLHFESDTYLSGGTFLGSGITKLNGPTIYEGGTIAVNGYLVEQNGTATVNAPTTINGTGRWDMDGIQGDTQWQINDDLTLNVNGLDQSNSQFDGRITLDSSGTTMTVNTPTDWTMNGMLIFHSGTVLDGSAQMYVTGTVRALSSRIDAPVAFQSGATVEVYVGNVLQFDGPTSYGGGIYRGGAIHQNGAANVTADTTLGQNLYEVPPTGGYLPVAPYIQWLNQFDWDGSVETAAVTSISPGVTLAINAVQIDGDSANDGYDGTMNVNGGTLLVNTGPRIVGGILPPGATIPATVAPAPWRLDGTMNLQEMGGHPAVVATQVGSPMYIYGEVNAVEGNASIAAPVGLFPTGQIQVSNGASLGMGLSAGGTIDIDPGGVLHLNRSSSMGASAHLIIDGTAELTSNTTFHGGTYEGAGTLELAGAEKIDDTTRLDVFTHFDANSTSTIATAQELQLGADAHIAAGAVLQGDGTLHNLFGSTLSLADGGEIGVELINDGVFSPGNSPGTVTVDTFTQGASGVLLIELGGGGQWDRVQVMNEVFLNGELHVSLHPGYKGDGDTFLNCGSGCSGMFTNILDGRVLTTDGLGSLELTFDASSNSYSLSNFELLSLPGDFDHDGDRDGRDFLIWQRGGSPHPLSAADLADWRANFGAAGSPASSQTVPEPATLLLTEFALLSVLGREVRKKRMSNWQID